MFDNKLLCPSKNKAYPYLISPGKRGFLLSVGTMESKFCKLVDIEPMEALALLTFDLIVCKQLVADRTSGPLPSSPPLVERRSRVSANCWRNRWWWKVTTQCLSLQREPVVYTRCICIDSNQEKKQPLLSQKETNIHKCLFLVGKWLLATTFPVLELWPHLPAVEATTRFLHAGSTRRWCVSTVGMNPLSFSCLHSCN